MDETQILIMLVDDDPINNLLNKKLITKKQVDNAQIIEFLDGKSAIEFLMQGPKRLPDLILLDINMPVMNGWEFLDHYQKLNLKIELYILSSSISREDIEKAKSYPEVKNFISKPLDDEKMDMIFS